MSAERTHAPSASPNRRTHETSSPVPALALELPPAVVEAIVAAVTERVVAELGDRGGGAWPEWMETKTAAAYLDLSVRQLERLTTDRAIPYSQDGGGHKRYYARSDLDAYRLRSRVRAIDG